MAFDTQFTDDARAVSLGLPDLVLGTCMLGSTYGEIMNAEVKRTADRELLEDCNGDLLAAIYRNPRFELTLETLLNASVTIPGIGDAITIPILGSSGRVDDATVKWANKTHRKLSVTATAFDSLAGATTLYSWNATTGVWSPV